MGGARDTHGEGKGAYFVSVGGNLRGSNYLKGLGVEERTILKWIFKK